MLSSLLLFAVLALTVYGQLMIKARSLALAAEPGTATSSLFGYLVSMFSDVGVLSSFAAAFLAAACWMLVVQRLDVGYAYPFMALSFVLVPIGSVVLFREPLPPMQLLGLGLIVAGVTVNALAR
jgi:multidrug transporter EmrE-like cation transporter